MCHYVTGEEFQFITYNDMYLGLKAFNFNDNNNKISSFLYPNYKYKFMPYEDNRFYLVGKPKQQPFRFAFMSKDFYGNSFLESLGCCVETKIKGGFHIEPFPKINKPKAKYKFPPHYSTGTCKETYKDHICIIGFNNPVFFDGNTVSATKLIVLNDADIKKLSEFPYFRSKDGRNIIGTTRRLYNMLINKRVKNKKKNEN